jgi:serine protease Do
LGSGVIVSENGYIITNNHVVEDSSEIRVVLSNGQEYSAKVIGHDPATDIAVVKVDGTNLPAITIADSSQLKVGDGVLAVGNPFGVGQTVTLGIVSATGRAGFGIVDYEDFIQTDASINPGNSGGALTDVTGRLVGINTAIISRTGGSQGIGFAVPSNMARHITEQIIEKGRVERGYLGVTIQPLTPNLAKAFNAEGTQGALVAAVSSHSPAARSGLKEGDVITEFNGKKVADSRHLRLMVAQTAPETRATLKVLRDGKEQSATVRLGELPDAQLAMGAQGRQSERGSGRGGFLQGLELTELTDRARQQFELPEDLDGVLVLGVQPGSAAERAGIEPGDVLTEVNRKKIKSVQDAVVAGRRGRDDPASVLLKIWSGGASRYVALEPATQERREEDR